MVDMRSIRLTMMYILAFFILVTLLGTLSTSSVTIPESLFSITQDDAVILTVTNSPTDAGKDVVIHPDFPLQVTYESPLPGPHTSVSMQLCPYNHDSTVTCLTPIIPTTTNTFTFPSSFSTLLSTLTMERAVMIPSYPTEAGIKIQLRVTIINLVKTQTASIDIYMVTPCHWVSTFDTNKLNCGLNAQCHPSNPDQHSYCECNVFSNAMTSPTRTVYTGRLCTTSITLYKQTDAAGAIDTPPFDSSGVMKLFSEQKLKLVGVDTTNVASQQYSLSPHDGNTPTFGAPPLIDASYTISAPTNPDLAPVMYDLTITAYNNISRIHWKAYIGTIRLFSTCAYGTAYVGDSESNFSTSKCRAIPTECQPFATTISGCPTQSSCSPMSQVVPVSLTPDSKTLQLQYNTPGNIPDPSEIIIKAFFFNKNSRSTYLIQIPASVYLIVNSNDSLTVDVQLEIPPPFIPADSIPNANQWILQLHTTSTNSNHNGCVYTYPIVVTDLTLSPGEGVGIGANDRLVASGRAPQTLSITPSSNSNVVIPYYLTPQIMLPGGPTLYTTRVKGNWPNITNKQITVFSPALPEVATLFHSFIYSSDSSHTYTVQQEVTTRPACGAVLSSVSDVVWKRSESKTFLIKSFGSYMNDNIQLMIDSSVPADIISNHFKPDINAFLVTALYPAGHINSGQTSTVTLHYKGYDASGDFVSWEHSCIAASIEVQVQGKFECPTDGQVAISYLGLENSKRIKLKIQSPVAILAQSQSYEITFDNENYQTITLFGNAPTPTPQADCFFYLDSTTSFKNLSYKLKFLYQFVNVDSTNTPCYAYLPSFTPSPCTQFQPSWNNLSINTNDFRDHGLEFQYSASGYAVTIHEGSIENQDTDTLVSDNQFTPTNDGLTVKSSTRLPSGQYLLTIIPDLGADGQFETCTAQTAVFTITDHCDDIQVESVEQLYLGTTTQIFSFTTPTNPVPLDVQIRFKHNNNQDHDFTVSDMEWDTQPGSDNIYIATITYPTALLLGRYSITIQIAECEQSLTLDVITEKITGEIESPSPPSRTVTLSWKIPPSRTRQYADDASRTTLYHRFTLHPKPTGDYQGLFPEPSTSLGLLTATSITFPSPVPNGEAIQINDISATLIPETASSATFTIPHVPSSLLTSQYVIMMSVVGPTDGYAATNTQEQVACLFYSSETLHSCPSTCPDDAPCNEYLGECKPTDPSPFVEYDPWVISPLVKWTGRDNRCTLSCPVHFVQNSECTQCLCQTKECITHTRSVQVSMSSIESPYLDNNYVMQGKATVQSYLATYITTLLGLHQLPIHDSLYRGSPSPSLQPLVAGSPKYSNFGPNGIGKESLFISFMNPTTKISYHDTLLITFSIQPTVPTTDPTNSLLDARFNELTKRLQYLIPHIASSTGALPPIFPSNNHPYLPFSFTFVPQTLSFFKHTPTGPISTARTYCHGTNPDNSGSVITGECPLSSSTLLAKSPFWSRCPTPYNQSNRTQFLSPVCKDYLNKEYKLAKKPWCTLGYPTYPATTSVTSCTPPSNVNTSPEPLKWTQTQHITIPIDQNTPITIGAGNQLLLGWEWGAQHSTTWSIDVIFTPTSTSGSTTTTGYSTILATVLGTQGNVSVTIPKLEQDTSATVQLRVTQNIKSKSNVTIPLLVTGFNLCTNGTNGPVTCNSDLNEICQPSTGECVCKNNYNRNSLGTKCILPCEGLCATSEDCKPESPFTCSKCPDDKMGSLCTIPKNCGNIDNNNIACTNNGFLPLSTTTGDTSTCSTECQCHNKWVGAKCDICALTDENITTQQQLCVPEHTDLIKTKASIADSGVNCGHCVCLDGYFGSNCQFSAIRGDVVFIKDDTEAVPFTTTSKLSSASLSLAALHQLTTNRNKPLGKMIKIHNATLYSQSSHLSSTTSSNIFTTTDLSAVTEGGREVLIRDLALSLGVEADLIQILSIQQGPNDIDGTSFIVTAGQTATTVQYSVTSGNSGLTLDDLTSSWQSLQTDFGNLPLSDSEVAREVGDVDSIGNAQQPQVKQDECTGENCDCTEAERLANNGVCPEKPKDDGSNSTGIIVGVVIVVVVVAGVFVGTVIGVRYAKKNQKCCFAPKNKGKKNSSKHNDDHLELTYTDSTSTATRTTQKSKTNPKSPSAMSSTAVDLVEITDHGEKLPPGWTKQKHSATGDVFYVNSSEMISQRHSPNDQNNSGNGW